MFYFDFELFFWTKWDTHVYYPDLKVIDYIPQSLKILETMHVKITHFRVLRFLQFKVLRLHSQVLTCMLAGDIKGSVLYSFMVKIINTILVYKRPR